jgi:putative addiction module component (TIGR02574 family)
MTAAKKVEIEAMKLSPKARAKLAERLLLSLDAPEEGDVMEAWLDEAERRLEAYANGKVSAIPATQVFREVRARLR